MILISNAVGLLIEVNAGRGGWVAAVEGHQGGEDSLLLEGEHAGSSNSRPRDVQHEQDEGVWRHRDEAFDGDFVSVGGGVRGVLADLRDAQVVVRLDYHLADELCVSVR